MTTGEQAIYGYQLDSALRTALTTVVPDEAVGWVERIIGAPVTSQRPLLGGTSSAMHLLETSADTPLDRVVLRRYVLDWVRGEPEIPGNEALALRIVGDGAAGVPAPQLLASDPDGTELGVPMTLMTALPGEPLWHPIDRAGWLRTLAELAVRIHAIPVSAELADWSPYAPARRVAPDWSRHPDAWLKAYELWDGLAPVSERVFVHRDFSPRQHLVDRVGDHRSGRLGLQLCRTARRGHRALSGQPGDPTRPGLGRRVSSRSGKRLTGQRDYDPYWDLTNVISFGHLRASEALDTFVAAAAARL